MNAQEKQLVVTRFGGIFLIISATLFVLWNLLSALSGNPPPQSEKITAWISAHSLSISLADEALSFAMYFLIPGCIGLWCRFWTNTKHPVLVVLTVSSIALSVLNLSMMNLFLGRLVYPVFGILPGSEAMAFSLSAYYGGLHMFDLVWASASILMGLLFFKSGYKIWFLLASIIVAIAELLVAYPWFFASEITFGLRIPFSILLIGVGASLIKYGMSPENRKLSSKST